MHSQDIVNILCIGGADPSSGAGIQSDIKAAQILGANCFSVVTAITAQNSKNFTHVEPVSKNSIAAQLDAIFEDFDVDVITIGMVYGPDAIKQIHSTLRRKKIPIVLDPVIKSTTGGTLLKKEALGLFKRLLVPMSYVVTPNQSEAEILSGMKIRHYKDLVEAAKAIGSKNVVITGHSFTKNKMSDFVYEDGKHYSISGKMLAGQNHGSGCIFAVSLAYALGQKRKMRDSVEFAKKFTYEAIKSAQKLGSGVKITRPIPDKLKSELGKAIKELVNLDGVASLIPECQMNFVFAKAGAKSLEDVVGVMGRIVRAGNGVVVAGSLEYGGSRHVATAVLTAQKKFPQLRSALNVKFNEDLLGKFAKTKNKILSYDRTKEPPSYKRKENASISWGINDAIKKSPSAPDIVYHKGDFGKEPMIIVFGKNPQNVVRKISKILGA
ncbi:MAG TPA: bifunctional hydroxymethylpyrimidine kinase/phosphomethylpyrimidine kinase [Candidatus Nitrosotenuis sp.]|jgi:hydroxymethylpyrimidine/phosphomethylpyrimidine kinase|nr:bifunctional hydroxymethylpyrimidine kinase/phosphomethylpyrimidine kinase [Candidatus Nitrosotenuis sp.]